MSEKRRKIQLQLAFMAEGRSEAPRASEGGAEALTAKRGTESPANNERWMERVCERENCKRALARVKANKGASGVDGMTVEELPGVSQATLAGDPGPVVERNLQAAAGEAGGDPEAGRRSAQARHSDGAGSVDPAGGDAGSARRVGAGVFLTQLRVPAAAVEASGGGSGARLHSRRPQLGGGRGSGEVLRSRPFTIDTGMTV